MKLKDKEKLEKRIQELSITCRYLPIRDYQDLTDEEKAIALEIIFDEIREDEKEWAKTEDRKPYRYRKNSPYILQRLNDTKWRWIENEDYPDWWIFEYTTGFYFD